MPKQKSHRKGFYLPSVHTKYFLSTYNLGYILSLTLLFITLEGTDACKYIIQSAEYLECTIYRWFKSGLWYCQCYRCLALRHGYIRMRLLTFCMCGGSIWFPWPSSVSCPVLDEAWGCRDEMRWRSSSLTWLIGLGPGLGVVTGSGLTSKTPVEVKLSLGADETWTGCSGWATGVWTWKRSGEGSWNIVAVPRTLVGMKTAEPLVTAPFRP